MLGPRPVQGFRSGASPRRTAMDRNRVKVGGAGPICSALPRRGCAESQIPVGRASNFASGSHEPAGVFL